MATVWLALRADVRRRWRALVSLALLLGLAGGVVLIAAAGARRTDTAYPAAAELGERLRGRGDTRRARSGVLRRASPAAAGRGGGDGECSTPSRCRYRTPSRPDSHGGPVQPGRDVRHDGRPGQDPAGTDVQPGGGGRGGDRPAARRMDAPGARATRCTCSRIPYTAEPGDGPGKLQPSADLPGGGHRRLRRPGGARHRDNSEPRSCSAPDSPAPPWPPGLWFQDSIVYLAQGGVRLRPGADPAAFIAAAQALAQPLSAGVRANGSLVFVDLPADDRHRAGHQAGRRRARDVRRAGRAHLARGASASCSPASCAGLGRVPDPERARHDPRRPARAVGRPARAGHGRRGDPRRRHRGRGVAADADRGRPAGRA